MFWRILVRRRKKIRYMSFVVLISYLLFWTHLLWVRFSKRGRLIFTFCFDFVLIHVYIFKTFDFCLFISDEKQWKKIQKLEKLHNNGEHLYSAFSTKLKALDTHRQYRVCGGRSYIECWIQCDPRITNLFILLIKTSYLLDCDTN